MSVSIKATKLTFKQTEAEWYQYHNTLREIALLREEIMNPYMEEEPNHEGGRSNIPGDPTGKMATRLTTHKQLKYLNEVVEAIDRVYEALPDNYKKLVRLRYWNKNNELDWDGVALKCHVSKRQAMRWRDEVIYATIELLGWR